MKTKLPDYQRMATSELCDVLTVTVGGPLACQAAERLASLHAELARRGDTKFPVSNQGELPLEIFGTRDAIERVRDLAVEVQRQTEKAESYARQGGEFRNEVEDLKKQLAEANEKLASLQADGQAVAVEVKPK